MSLDYSARPTEDSPWGPRTQAALNGHYVKYGETQYMVAALEILFLSKSRNPDDVECPGEFGSNLTSTVTQYRTDHGWSPTSTADAPLFHSLTV